MNGIPTTFIVQGALWLLVVFSVVTWTLIVVKAIQSLRSSAHAGVRAARRIRSSALSCSTPCNDAPRRATRPTHGGAGRSA
ncbi:MotA/TolQ/ExbB proton channel family protein [Burkholderia cenocepacia]|uniref:hypothetical protein n=1 Tax=Burkholderia cenocepacia TaxID=95486 RepID=UPI0009E103C0|nr:hypothetical protein [Burkholderia cenocepacia]ARF87359.1 MotA/TolQ/ExbB proton channel family protein [Burkholderia cenocepacia]